MAGAEIKQEFQEESIGDDYQTPQERAEADDQKKKEATIREVVKDLLYSRPGRQFVEELASPAKAEGSKVNDLQNLYGMIRDNIADKLDCDNKGGRYINLKGKDVTEDIKTKYSDEEIAPLVVEHVIRLDGEDSPIYSGLITLIRKVSK